MKGANLIDTFTNTLVYLGKASLLKYSQPTGLHALVVCCAGVLWIHSYIRHHTFLWLRAVGSAEWSALEQH
jgi:hypothetical protein